MAEAVHSHLVPTILGALGPLLTPEIGLASGMKNELKKLKDSLSAINAILLDAEKKGTTNHAVKNWLRKLKEVAYDAEDVLDEFKTKALRQKVELPNNTVAKKVRKCFSRLNNPLIFRLKMAHKIKDIMERLDNIRKDNVYSTFQCIPPPTHGGGGMDIDDEADWRHTDPFVIESEVLGREEDRENLVKELIRDSSGNSQDQNVMVIPIIGIGGLGKTTLAQYVYNDERIKNHFELQMWVCVSFDFNVVHLAKKILESLSNEDNCGNLGGNQAKSKLMGKLSGKRYLLVLDDVWNDHPSKWENLRKLLIGGASGSMILVTTRNQDVASIMDPIKLFYHLEELNKNDCELLFNKRAFGEGEENTNHPELVEIGKEIVKKCGGVPLAAKALGSLLRPSRNKKEWLDVLKTEIWNLGEREREILPALRISYNQLPSHLKQCFAYCSLFPQDHEIDVVDDLIHQWMAHGFIQPLPPRSESSLTMEDIGNRYFRELLWRSFFQEVREDRFGNILKCKMHDLVHNLARLVAGNEWSEIDLGNTPISDMSHGDRDSKHMVFHWEKGDPLSHQTLIRSIDKPQKLRTLYLQLPFPHWGLRFSDAFVSSLQGLRVLKLGGLEIEHVPSSIGYLEQLRYLDLSLNCFRALPNSICSLYNLQTLRLKDCFFLEELPRDMTKMVSLRHLELDYLMGNNLKYMPRGLGQLASLQTSGYFIVGQKEKSSLLKMGGLGELHGLNQLGGSLFIDGLGNVRDAREAAEAKLKDKSEFLSLILSFSRMLQSSLQKEAVVLENLQPHPNLKELSITNYEGVKMPRWMIRSSSLLPNLVELTMESCSNLKCLPLIGEFPCLKCLYLESLDDLESICNKVVVPSVRTRRDINNNIQGRGGEGNPLGLVLFPSLQQLTLIIMPKLEKWTISVVEEGEEESVAEEEALQHNHLHLLSSMFPRLTDLDLFECHKLTTVPMLSVGGTQHLTSLRILSIQHLDRLVSLPDCPAPSTLEELHIHCCPSLVRLPDCFFENLKLLSQVHIRHCSKLTTLPEGLGNLSSLQVLEIQDCPNLSSLPEGLQHLTTLKELRIAEYPGLTTLPEGLGNLSSLQVLEIWSCPNLSSLPKGLQHLTTLKELTIEECPSLTTLPEGLGNLSSLQRLLIWGCPNLSSLPKGLQHLTTLKELRIVEYPGLTTLPEGLGNLSSLQVLQIEYCSNLSSLPEGLQHLTTLKELKIEGCPGLTTLPEGLGNLSSLQVLQIKYCPNLSSLPEGLQHLTTLKGLTIERCLGFTTLPEGLGNLSSLQNLQIWNCPNLSSLPQGIEDLTALERLTIHKCPRLRALPHWLRNLASRGVLAISD